MYKLTRKKRKKLGEEIAFQYSRSSGPGGQKVNKTETQVELRWNVNASEVFHDNQKKRIFDKLNNRINKESELIVSSEKFRSRPRNQDNAVEVFFNLLEGALTVPKPRKKTKPGRGAVERRLQDKKKQAEKKKYRQKI